MQQEHAAGQLESSAQLDHHIVQLARFALESGAPEVQSLLRKLARRHRETHPALTEGIVELLRESPVRSAALRRAVEAQPVDLDSRTPLVREESVPELSIEPVFMDAVAGPLDQLVREHLNSHRLAAAGLAPTRTALFVGPPGVGKTLAARWVASSLGIPLITLDLSSVMSSYLGRTGDNLRRVLDYAKARKCVLLLDELDAVAKRRDDVSEIGELKRLVTVLLQEVDYWPQGSLLIAATNHDDLLDPAVWRRFELTVHFPQPTAKALATAAMRYLEGETVSAAVLHLLGSAYSGMSFSDLEQAVSRARRVAALEGTLVEHELLRSARHRVLQNPSTDRIAVAVSLVQEFGMSQRQAHELTGVSRDTIRRHCRVDQEKGAVARA